MECLFGLLNIDPSNAVHLEAKNAYNKKSANLSGFCEWALVRHNCCSILSESADLDSACVASIIRLVYSIQTAHAADLTYSIVKVAMWRYQTAFSLIMDGPLTCLKASPN